MPIASRGRYLLCHAVVWLLFAVLAGCGSAPPKAPGSSTIPPVTPRSGPAPPAERDGADTRVPPDLTSVPDAEPRIEPIRSGGPNRPYEMLGRDYVPITEDRPFTERGMASWYGKKFHGRKTASGEVYNMYAMTAAHPTLPIPSYVRVVNPANKREVVVRINDRGPFHRGRVIDLSYTAAIKLGVLNGIAPVELTRITFEEIRSGAWRRNGAPAAPEPPPTEVAAAPPAPEPTPSTAEPVVAASAKPAPGFWVQIGVFRQREGADGFHRRVIADLDWLAPLLTVFSESSSHRLQAGPYRSRDEAQGAAARVREALNLVPVIVERK
jgi:rare lipoprotein A